MVKYITQECLASTESAVLHSSIPLGLDDIAPGNTPALANALCKFRSVEFVVFPEVETSERLFHSWLQENMTLGQVPFLYCSPLHHTFLKVRFAEQLHLANISPGNRGEIIRVLLESARVGSNEHSQLNFAPRER